MTVDWTVDATGPARSVSLRWVESGGPPVDPPARKGFGTALIERSMAYELDGAAQVDYRPDGVRCELSFPLAAAGDSLLQEAENSAEQLRSDLESRTQP